MDGHSRQGKEKLAQALLAGNGLESTVLLRALFLTSTGRSLPLGQGRGAKQWGHPRSISAVK